MCLGPCLFFIEFLPYICLVSLPLYGAFCGIDVILRFSLLLCIHSIIVEYIPKFLYFIIPFLQLGILIGLVLLPINLTPAPIVWVYDKLLWATEPLLLLAEVVLVQNLVMRCSQRASENIEDGDEDSGFKWKCLILVFSVVCYGTGVWLLWNIYHYGSAVQLWVVFLVLMVLVAIHNMMWMAIQEGILSDAAFCSLCSLLVVYAMVEETSHIREPLSPPPTWRRSYAKSLVDILYSIVSMKAETAMKAVLFFKKFISPFFLMTVAVRLYSILFIVNKATRNFTKGDSNITLLEDTEEAETVMSELSPWKSPIILRLSVIFMFTQITVLFLSECSGGFLAQFDWALGPKSIWPTQLLIGRIFQVIAINSFYMWRLYRSDDWTWSEWLSPE